MNLNRKEIIIAAAGIMAGLLIFFVISQFTGSSGQQQEVTTEQHEDHEQIWTCSMHPQIRQNEPGQCPICGMDLIPVSRQSGNGAGTSYIHTMSPEAAALANVQTARVSYVTPEYKVWLNGRIAANEQKLSVVTADYSGRIERLFVNFTGQTVNKGEKMATIYSPELVTAQRELMEAAKNKQSNPLLYNAVREKLRLWNITEKQMDAIETGNEVRTELDIYANISGVVMTRNVSTGDYVSRGNVLFEIADLSSVWVILDAYESDLAWIKTGARINFTVPSIPGREFTSTIAFVDPIINPQTRTVSIRAEAGNPGLALKPEMFVRASISAQISVDQRSLVIPVTSILWTGTRSVVYVKVPDTEYPAFEMREVDLGSRAGDFYVVEAGLAEDENIITNGVFAVDAAAQLSGNYSMMNRPVSKRISVPEDFKLQLTNLANSYFNLKNTLVKDNYAGSRNNAVKVSQSLKSVDMKILNEGARQKWTVLENQMRSSVDLISKSKSIEEQRDHFEILSDAMIESAEYFGLKVNMVYVQFCPMAFDDKGAQWLSESDEILNPYFGDDMLRCGEVTKKISSVDSYQDSEDTPKPTIEHQH
jgi:membrane fusion protein, copper/silver efflux system